MNSIAKRRYLFIFLVGFLFFNPLSANGATKNGCDQHLKKTVSENRLEIEITKKKNSIELKLHEEDPPLKLTLPDIKVGQADDPRKLLNKHLPSLLKQANIRAERNGFTLPEVIVVMGIMAVLLGLLVPVVQKSRESAARLTCQNNVKQLTCAIHNFHSEKGHFPQAYYKDTAISASGKWPNVPWTTLILPYIERDAEAQLPGQHLTGKIMKNFHCPMDPRMEKKGHYSALTPGAMTSYNAIDGSATGSPTGPQGVPPPPLNFGQGTTLFPKDGLMHGSSTVSLEKVEGQDGASNTLLIGERPPDASTGWGWTFYGAFDNTLSAKTFNYPPAYAGCPTPGVFGPGKITDQCSGTHYWSLHQGGAFFGFGDGSVRFIKYNINPDLLPAMATWKGGEIIPVTGD